MGAVRQFHVQLRDELREIAVDATHLEQVHMAGIPAITQQRANGIRARPKEAGDIAGLILKARTVVGVPGSQQFIPHAAAVDPHLVKSPRRNGKRGAADRAVEIKFPAQQGHARDGESFRRVRHARVQGRRIHQRDG